MPGAGVCHFGRHLERRTDSRGLTNAGRAGRIECIGQSGMREQYRYWRKVV